MKHFYNIIILLISVNINVFAQSDIFKQNRQNIDTAIIKCQYRYTYVPDTINGKERNDVMNLEIGKKVCKFYSYLCVLSDSAIVERHGNAVRLNMSKDVSTENKYQIYTYQDSIYTYDIVFGNRYLYKEYKQYPQWKIYNDTKTIISYKCKKATCKYRGREYVAWFAPEINLNCGPYKFGGLPGLILEIEDTKHQHKFECIAIEKWQKPIYKRITKISNISKTDFIKTRQKYNNNPLGFFRTMPIILPKNINIPTAKITFPYNPIELEE